MHHDVISSDHKIVCQTPVFHCRIGLFHSLGSAVHLLCVLPYTRLNNIIKTCNIYSDISLPSTIIFVFSFRMFWIAHVVAVYSIVQLIGHYHVQGEEYEEYSFFT